MIEIKAERIRNIYTIGIIIGIIIFITSVFAPWVTWAHRTEYPLGSHTEQESLFGFSALFYGGWFGLLFIIVSLGYIYSWNVWKAIITNIVGCILICINILVWPDIGPTLVPSYARSVSISYGYYYGIVSLVFFCLLLLFLIENRNVINTMKTLKPEKLENKPIEEKLVCPSCNSEIIDKTSTFCNKCGSPLN